MPEEFLKPVCMTRGGLVELLRMISKAIEDGDSVEGNLEYSGLAEGLAWGKFNVIGAVRFGNRDGQGCMRIIGQFGDTAIDAKMPAPHAETPRLKAEDLPTPIYQAIRAVVNYNWRDERADYIHECGDGPGDNQRKDHVFESLVVLNNLIEDMNQSPRDYLPENERDANCAAGMHSWVDDPSIREGNCTRCGEPYQS